MHGNQRTRASSVNRHAGPPPVKEEAQPVPNDGPVRAGGKVGGHLVDIPEQGVVPVDTHATDIDTGVASPQGLDAVAARLEGLVHGLHEQTLLGIDAVGFVGGDVEEGGVKVGEVLGEEVGVADVGGAMV